ncbi:MAG: ethanolamine utilization protein EutH [Ruminococcaceae bacterium]|nr:ethanolamine utilization protein EutH [Oscillospiraceae bacterium]
MNAITIVVLIFAIIGALDKLFGDKIGLGKEFQHGFELFTPMVFSMMGMLVIAPAVGVWLTPAFEWFYNTLHIDPSIIPASLFANDMGGMTLAQSICKNDNIGGYNAFVISSMMGCVISFTIPFSISTVKKEQHKELFFGLLCGIVTIPIGSFIAGLMCGLGALETFINLLPLIILSVLIVLGLLFAKNICIKIFSIFGIFMRAVAIIGLIFAIFTFLTKIEINPHFDTLENAAFICVNASVTLAGALPFMFVVSKLLNKPLGKLGEKIGINDTSAICLLSTLVTNVPTIGLMNKMNKKGTALNAAFAVSAGFTFGGHLALTMAFEPKYVTPMIVAKLISGVCAVILTMLIHKEKAE